ncbi:hypothetical protein Sjap_022798 [Stephania japonica]|uniref:Glycosyltransferase n=1 Tax=Stephania japonica TaxID=461633 RepID=A0AAP0EQ28_9MAGN
MASPSVPQSENMASGCEAPHVLLVAFSSQGHLNPMLRLGKRLSSKGLHVTLASTDIARQRILSSLATATTTTTTTNNSTSLTIPTDPHEHPIHLQFFSDGLPLDYDRRANLDHYMDTLGKAGPTNLSHLITASPHNFACIVMNPFVPWVSDVATQHHIPCAMLWIQPCALYAIYYRFYNQLNHFPITLTDPNTTCSQLPGLPLLTTRDLPSFILPSNHFDSFPKLFSNMFKNMANIKWVLANSFYELEKEVVDSMTQISPIRPIGPLIPPILLGDSNSSDVGIDMWKPDETCIEWLDNRPNSSVVYVSFGSIAVLSKNQMGSLAEGLKSSGCAFLWVVKEGELPEGFVEEVAGRGLVVKWSPQIKVLMHPSVGCFVTHCGWNSTLETVACGVPVITFPQWSDQPTNAKLITDVFGVGLTLRVDDQGEGDEERIVRSEEVVRCIGEVMGGPKCGELKRRALELRQAARRAVTENGSSDRNIDDFIKEISGSDFPRDDQAL